MPNGGVSCRTPVSKARLGMRRKVPDAVLNQTFLAPWVFFSPVIKTLERVLQFIT
jgi:hypothetical protein